MKVICRSFLEEQRFSDIFNASCFLGGAQIVDAGKLRKTAARIQTKVPDGEKRKRIYRNIRMQLPKETKYILLTVENQINDIHRKKQKEFRKQHGGGTGKIHNGKLTEKMNETDRLYPVYTICFYHGSDPWKGPRILKEMADSGEIGEAWQNLFCDYRILFVDVEDPQLAERCRTELKLL